MINRSGLRKEKEVNRDGDQAHKTTATQNSIAGKKTKTTREVKRRSHLEADAVISLLHVVELVEELPAKLVGNANHVRPQLLCFLEPPRALSAASGTHPPQQQQCEKKQRSEITTLGRTFKSGRSEDTTRKSIHER